MFKSLLAALLLLFGSLAHSMDAPLVLGVFPYISRGQLVEYHNALKLYLEKQLHRPVELVTAPNFNDFVTRTQRGDYDLVLTAPHMARIAETRAGYLRLVKSGHEVTGIFLARKDSNIRKISDLKGKTLMIAQPISVIYQMAEARLRDAGLTPGVDVTIVDSPTHNNSLYAPMRRETDASVTGTLLWGNAEPEVRAHLVEIGQTHSVPGFVILANRRLPSGLVNQVQSSLLDFGKTPQGKVYFNTTGLKQFLKVDDKTMKQLDPYTSILTVPSTSPP